MKKFNIIPLIQIIIIFTGQALFAQYGKFEDPNPNCFTITAGKNATVDGSVILAHNEDDGGEMLVDWYKVPRLKHKPGEQIILRNNGKIDQVSETYSYLWMQMPGMQFADSYINEQGVAIASNQCISRETEGELTAGGIGYFLRRIMAERAGTAREAVKIAGAIIEQAGYLHSGRSYSIADPNEAWVMAVVQGRHWAAKRVPDDEIAVIPNYYTLEEIDLTDTLNYLGSKDIIKYAASRGWYNPKTDGEFSFRLAYSRPDILYGVWNIARHLTGAGILAGKEFKYRGRIPFSFKPMQKVGLKDFMKVLHNHYEGTQFEMNPELDNGNPHKNIVKRICSISTQYGTIAQLRSWLPAEIGSVLWTAQRRPCTQPFIPWYLGIKEIPAGHSRGDFKDALETHFSGPEDIRSISKDHSFWKYADFAAKTDADYSKLIDAVKESKATLQQKLFSEQKGFEEEVLKIYKKDPAQAGKMLTEYTAKAAKAALVRMKAKDLNE